LSEFIRSTFAAGELAPELHGQVDLQRYELGAAEIENFVINYGGGAFKRFGTRFVDYLDKDELPIKLFSFTFSDDLDNSYLIIFGDGYIRFIRNRGYVVEDEKVVTEVVGNVASSIAHGYATGDLVFVNGVLFKVTSVTANAFRVVGLGDTTAELTLGNASRVFTLANPFASSDFAEIKYYQLFDQIKFTHISYPPYVLKREATFWSIAKEVRNAGKVLLQTPRIETSGKFISYIKILTGGDGHNNATPLIMADPTGTGFEGITTVNSGALVGITIVDPGQNFTSPTLTTGTAGTQPTFDIGLAKAEASLAVVISAVFPDGSETGPSRPLIAQNVVDFTQSAGFAKYVWDAVPGADSYRVFRSLVFPASDQANNGVDFGFIGETRALNFTDNNIIPDFTDTPKLYRDPLAAGKIEFVRVLTPGSGYLHSSTATVVDSTGSGFVGYPIIEDGIIVAVFIADPGSGYTAPVLTFSDGVGATFAISLGATSGTYPATSFIFQQRAGYAGTRNSPMTVFASRLQEFDNFGTNDVVDSRDPFTFDIDSTTVSPIRHTFPGRRGLLVFTQTAVHLLRASDGQAVTALNGTLDPQSAIGASQTRPLLVDEDVLYVRDKHRGVMLLTFNGNSLQYESSEASILARHLFERRRVVAMDFAYETEKQGFFVTSDGTAVSATLIKGESAYGFTRITTNGRYLDIAATDAGDEKHLYFIVERLIGGRKTKVIEVYVPEVSREIEDAVYLDCATSVEKINPAADISLDGNIVTATASVFTSEDVGKILGFSFGRGVVAEVVSSTSARLTILRAFKGTFQEAGEWFLNPVVTTISGIPLRDRYVTAVVDGRVEAPQLVVDGSITLRNPGAIVHVGLPYDATLRTLPVGPTRGSRVHIHSAFLTHNRTAPFLFGRSLDSLYDTPKRSYEPWIEPVPLDPGGEHVNLGGGWDDNGQLYVVAPLPLPCEILQIVIDLARGDGKRSATDS
jgi:hypothetical protein